MGQGNFCSKTRLSGFFFWFVFCFFVFLTLSNEQSDMLYVLSATIHTAYP